MASPGETGMTAVDCRPTPEQPDDDPHLWLEDKESAAALAWVEAQNAATLGRFGDGRFAADRDRLKAIFDRPDKLPHIARRGERIFNFWQDEANPRGVWRTTSLDRFAGADPEWDILLDLDRLAEEEGEDWVWGGAATLPGAHDRAILRLSRGGGDAAVLREFDLTARAFVADGFRLPEAKGGLPAWLDRDTLLLVSSFGDGMANSAGYPRTVRVWKRDTEASAAAIILETSNDAHWIAAGVEHDGAFERLWFFEGDHSQARIWFGDRGGPNQRIAVPPDALVNTSGARAGDWIAIRLRSPWTIGDTTYAAETILGISLPAFLAGDRRFAVLFEPGPRRTVEHFFWCGGHLLLCILDDLRKIFDRLTPSAGAWSRERLPGLPENGTVTLYPLDRVEEESNGDLLAEAQDPLTPPSLFLLRPGEPPRLLKRAAPAFRTDGLVITRHEAVSSDGTSVPYTRVGPAGDTGDAPVLLRGYGGFGVNAMPCYDSAAGALWLERGGTLVIANIRGGGEFGAAWHQAGRREGRRRSYEDFAAVAADLAARGVTRPGRIAAEGGSNGGLLVANMLTRYPERFGAIACTIPLIDMRRYTRLGGAIWIDEYGDPDRPEDWRFLAGISAYHTAAPGRPYPPVLIHTNRRDDRVHCGHGRKMAAKLRAMGHGEAYFFEPESGGHSYGANNAQAAAFLALEFRFLRHAIAWEPAEGSPCP